MIRRSGRADRWRGQAGGRALLTAMAIGSATLLGTAAGWAQGAGRPSSGVAVAQGAASTPPAGPPRFRYDAPSGRCLDADGREGYNPGSREDLEETGQAECANFSGRHLNMTYLRLVRANLRGANFANVLWYLGSITDSDLTGADLSGTTGQMNYAGSQLRQIRLTGAYLTWSDLRDADLAGADLRNARFSQHTQLPFDHDEARRLGMVYVPSP